MNLATWVERHGRGLRDRPALAQGARVHSTWSQFAATVAATASGLREERALEG